MHELRTSNSKLRLECDSLKKVVKELTEASRAVFLYRPHDQKTLDPVDGCRKDCVRCRLEAAILKGEEAVK